MLFGFTDRWTKLCKQLALQGVIDEPDVSFTVDDGALPGLEDTVRGLDRREASSGWDYDDTDSTYTGSDSASSSGSSGSSGSGGGGVSGGSH